MSCYGLQVGEGLVVQGATGLLWPELAAVQQVDQGRWVRCVLTRRRPNRNISDSALTQAALAMPLATSCPLARITLQAVAGGCFEGSV